MSGIDIWKIEENNADFEDNLLKETIFSVANGHFGIRGTIEEGYSDVIKNSRGTFMNGFYESVPIKYGESAYGYAQNNQIMLNLPDMASFKLFYNNERILFGKTKILSHKRYLDLKRGVLERETEYKMDNGDRILVNIKKIISFVNRDFGAMKTTVRVLEGNGKIEILTGMDEEVSNIEHEGDPRVGADLSDFGLKTCKSYFETNSHYLVKQTVNSEKKLLCSYFVDTEENAIFENNMFKIIKDNVETGSGLEFIKYVSYSDISGLKDDSEINRIRMEADSLMEKGFEDFILCQEEYLHEYWKKSQVEILGNDKLQQGLNYNQFQLLQSVGKDGKTNISAKGLSGEGYGGHYFWDTEIYMFPYFLFSNPAIARELLEYRYFILDKARERARQMSHEKGALYPWRTIAGEECSAFFPAGTAQYHINADVAHAIKLYYLATGDVDFVLDMGAEMLFETARLWVDLGHFSSNKFDQFCIDSVTGPDEYTAVVNNNFYTNMMAKENLLFAAEIYELINKKYHDRCLGISAKIKLSETEVEEWHKAASNMYIPYDHDLKVHPQDDTFLNKKVWDFKNTPANKYPLLLHFHPLVIYRHQVCKQADVVLAEFLCGDKFSIDQKKRDFDYYEPLTTHDSSLSKSVFSIMASEVGYENMAYEFFEENVRMDLDNSHNNSQYGIHTASMGGSWMCVIYGFAGMRTYDGELSFKPYLPKGWEGYGFKIDFGGTTLHVKINGNEVSYQNIGENDTMLFHGDREFKLEPGEKKIMK